MTILAPAFFVTAMLYAMVGFGGGSTYNALLAVAETDYRLMPAIALICNLIVVGGGTYHFVKSGHLNIRQAAPWAIASVPAAWLGGYIDVPERLFYGLLGLVLVVAGALILRKPDEQTVDVSKPAPTKYSLLPLGVGGALGFLSGVVGIGGGIFLAPVLYLLRLGTPRSIAATCSFFILVNSLAGLSGQIMKLSHLGSLVEIEEYWLVFPAVLIGGQIGSRMGAARIDPGVIRIFTGLLIFYAAIRLLWRWWGMG